MQLKHLVTLQNAKFHFGLDRRKGLKMYQMNCDTRLVRNHHWLTGLIMIVGIVNGARRIFFAVALLLCGLTIVPSTAQPLPQVNGDEPFIVTHHQLRLPSGPLIYDATAGRLPIRDGASGAVRGYVFFTAYTVKPRAGERRPLAFIWNGGPGAPATLLHMQMFGPRRLEGGRVVDNAETLLTDSDLVFVDPVGTGFSRSDRPAVPEFYSVLGDFAVTTEFIRAYRARFLAEGQPLFLVGESYGTWRVSGVAELLVKRHVAVAGAVLISGGIPGSLMPPTFNDAMFVPARTATAFHFRKLSPALMADRTRTLADAERWAHDVYLPALNARERLLPAERERIAVDLARYTGIDPASIDRRSLVVSNNQFRSTLLGTNGAAVLNPLDMRIPGELPVAADARDAMMRYFRGELGYATDLAYLDEEEGYVPFGGPAIASPGEQWVWNHVVETPEMTARMQAGSGPQASQPWLQRAMRGDPELRVLVAAGRYDSYNMCAGNTYMVAKLEPPLARRFTLRCYDTGHMMYVGDPANRRALGHDVREFFRAGRPS